MRVQIHLAFVIATTASLGLAAAAEPVVAKVDVNVAGQAELETLPGIGPTRARMIIRIRETSGPFRSIEELRAIPRLTSKQFEKLRLHVKPIRPDEPRGTALHKHMVEMVEVNEPQDSTNRSARE